MVLDGICSGMEKAMGRGDLAALWVFGCSPCGLARGKRRAEWR